MPNDFPTAIKVDPIFEIDQRFYRKVTHADGQKNASAIRALVTLDKPDSNGATTRMAWFVPVDLPAGYTLMGTPEAGGVKGDEAV